MSLSETCKSFGACGKSKEFSHLNILAFCEDIVQVTPSPVQRFILKCFYGMPLNKQDRDIEIYDHFKENILYKFTEFEYWQFLRGEGRISLKDADFIPDANFWTLCLPIGRRGGKTFLSAVISSYECYRILQIHHPQAFFGIDEGSEIGFTTVATARPQAALLYGMTRNFILRGSVFNRHRVTETLSYILLDSEHDIEKYGKGKRPSIKITFNSCISRTLRGPGNIVGVMDECCHYITESASASSDVQVYNALDPSISSFNKDGKMFGKMIMISSPLNKTGIMYEKYKESLQTGDETGTLMISAPVWEVHPSNVTPKYLKSKFRENKDNFWREFGAQFSERTAGWLEDQHLRRVLIPELIPAARGAPGVPSFMGIDLGLSGNGTAVCISVVNSDREIELIHTDAWYPRNAVLDPIYEKYVKNVEMLDFDEIADWIQKLVVLYNVKEGLFDHWTGVAFQQALNKRKVPQLKCTVITRDLKAKMYQNFYLMMLDKKLRLFNDGEPKEGSDEKKDSVLITELLRLQKKTLAGYMVLVNKPEVTGYQDDFSDALIRSVWCATENLDLASKISSSLENRRFKQPNYEALQRLYALKRRPYVNQRPVMGKVRRGKF